MDSATIRTFLRIAAVGSLTRTAELTGMSQPTLTRLLRDLEAELGVALFERGRRGVVLTDEGRHFAERAPAVLDAMDTLVAETASSRGRIAGRIGVGVPYAMTDTIALPLVRWLRKAHPEASIALQQGVSHEIEQELIFGQIDLGILISPRTQAPLRSVLPLAGEALNLFVSPHAGWPEGNRAGWDDLAGRDMILPREQNVLRRRLDQSAAQRGLTLRIVAEISNPEATLELVSMGDGATILPASLGADRVAAGLLVAVPFGNESVVWTLGISALSAATRLRSAVTKKLVELFDHQVAEGRWRPAG